MMNRFDSSEFKKKTETVSFRIDSHIRSALEEEAANIGTNLNSLVSQIFVRHVSWGRYASKLKFLPSSKDLMRELFQAIPRENVEKIAKRLGENQSREEILFLFRQISPVSVLRYIQLWSSHFDACEHYDDGKRHFFTIHHDVNLNFSLFAKEYVATMIQTTLNRSPRFETVSPSSLTFDFEG